MLKDLEGDDTGATGIVVDDRGGRDFWGDDGEDVGSDVPGYPSSVFLVGVGHLIKMGDHVFVVVRVVVVVGHGGWVSFGCWMGLDYGTRLIAKGTGWRYFGKGAKADYRTKVLFESFANVIEL